MIEEEEEKKKLIIYNYKLKYITHTLDISELSLELGNVKGFMLTESVGLLFCELLYQNVKLIKLM